jgi:hypothetical protein
MEVGVDALEQGFAAAVAAVAGDAQLEGGLREGFVVVFAELAERGGDVIEGDAEVVIS